MSTGKCPSCLNTYPLEPRFYGKKVKCNLCGHVFDVYAPATDGGDVTSASKGRGTEEQNASPKLTVPVPVPLKLPPPHPDGLEPDSSQLRTKKHGGNGKKVVPAIVAVVAAIWWFSSSNEHIPSWVTSQQNAQSYPIGRGANLKSGQGRYTESEALKEIRAERAQYTAQQRAALTANRARRDATRKAGTDRNLMRLSTIRNEILSLKQKLTFGSIGKPSEPIILNANAFSRQLVLDYIEEYREWGEDRLALQREVFALQDEEAKLTAGDPYSAYSSPLSELMMEITSHQITKPHEDVLSLIGDSQVRKYRRAVYADQLEQWLAEAELMDKRREKLLTDSTACITQQPRHATKTADVATGPWKFERCVDGDTIEITICYNGPKEKVRLLNINAPEKGQSGYYQATAALNSLLQYRSIELEFEEHGEPTRDRYGRVLAFVFVDETLVNYEMVKNGWSEFYTDYGRGRYALPIEFAEADAWANR